MSRSDAQHGEMQVVVVMMFSFGLSICNLCFSSSVSWIFVHHSFLSSSRPQVELFSSCRNHRTGAAGAQEGPAAGDRTGRTGRTRHGVSLGWNEVDN